MSAAQTHSFFSADQKIEQIDAKIQAVEREIVYFKKQSAGHALVALWKAIATDYRAAKARQNVSRETMGEKS